MTSREESKSSLEACTINIIPNYIFMTLLHQCPWGKDFGAFYFAICCHHSELFVFYWCVVVQSLSHMQLIATPRTAACQAPLSSTISQSLLKFMSIESVMLSNHLIVCCPPPLFAFTLSQHLGLFHWVSSSISWLKHWSLRFSISLNNGYSGLIFL